MTKVSQSASRDQRTFINNLNKVTSTQDISLTKKTFTDEIDDEIKKLQHLRTFTLGSEQLKAIRELTNSIIRQLQSECDYTSQMV